MGLADRAEVLGPQAASEAVKPPGVHVAEDPERYNKAWWSWFEDARSTLYYPRNCL